MKSTKEKAALLVERLLRFGIENKLIEEPDIIYVRNSMLDLLGIDEPYGDIEEAAYMETPEYATPILEELLDYCADSGLISENTLTWRDLMDTRIMGLMMPRPSCVIESFNTIRKENGIEAATDYFYQLCLKSDYIRAERIKRNLRWDYQSPYGTLEITINLTKPEKDPKEIAALKNAPQSGYPKCLLCPENVGYAGRLNHPARQTHRTIPVSLQGENWYFQYSPYVYYNEHCIVFKEEHVPMKISRRTFARLFDFLEEYPHYFIGSNADLPIVGGSILNHDHFQGGRYVFPMEKAGIEYRLSSKHFAEVEGSVINWPMSAMRLRSAGSEPLIDAANALLAAWRGYSDESAGILAYTRDDKGNTIPHNTITPISRKASDGRYEMDLVFRNNRTSSEHPLGIFHPHRDLHHIKKENIGLIEVMGLFILPGRLQKELGEISEYLTGSKAYDWDALADPANPLSKHAEWLDGLVQKNGTRLTPKEADMVLKDAVGRKCQRVLEDAGVFKTDADGRKAFDRFLKTAGWERNL